MGFSVMQALRVPPDSFERSARSISPTTGSHWLGHDVREQLDSDASAGTRAVSPKSSLNPVLEDSRLAKAVGSATRRASYADARYVERESEAVTVKDGQIEGVDRTADRGVGVRVIVDGAWGFAASDRAASDDQLAALFGEAIHRAEAAATVHRAPVA